MLLATPQIPDRMEVDGETVRVHGFKLSSALKEYMRETERRRWEAAEAEGRAVGVAISSANWDGFYATLVLEDRKLYLTELRTEASEEVVFERLDCVVHPRVDLWVVGDPGASVFEA